MSSSEGTESDDEMGQSSDSEMELQVALKDGLLAKNGLNIAKEKKQLRINKKDELEQSFSRLHKKRDWISNLNVNFSPELSYTGPVTSDFEREAAFVKQAQNAVGIALPRLHSLKVPIFRPDDYFAEMAKTDGHMHKVRRRLLDIQKEGEKRDAKKRLRNEKKFATKVQQANKEKKHKDKRVLMEAVKKHRKGMKAQLETMLNNASGFAGDDDDEQPSGRPSRGGKSSNKMMSRVSRNKKYGFGGQKKRSKRNDKDSFETPFGQGSGTRGKRSFQQRGGKRGRGSAR